MEQIANLKQEMTSVGATGARCRRNAGKDWSWDGWSFPREEEVVGVVHRD